MLPTNSGVYEQRHVLFCDILGFSAAVRDGTISPISILRLLRELKDLEVEANRPIDPEAVEPETGRRPDHVIQPRATYFSDCIAISVPATNNDAIWLCDMASHMQKVLVHAGFLCRGAICTGDLYHDADLLFGPAFIRAVEQEKATEFPRIAVDQLTVDYFRVIETEGDREISQSRQYQLLIHEGDTTYVDPFNHLKFFARSPEPPPHPWVRPEIDAWRRVVMRGLDTTHPRTKAKYEWAANEFNRRMAPEGSWVPRIEVPILRTGAAAPTS